MRLSEMRGSGEMTPAHQTDGLAELVCSNSFRSDDDTKNAVGLLHHEMRELDSASSCEQAKSRGFRLGSAMAVDRDVFSAEVEKESAQSIPMSRSCANASMPCPTPGSPSSQPGR